MDQSVNLPSTILIERATSTVQLQHIRTLFEEYAKSLDFSLCFQGFDRELAELPGDYVPPQGRLLLASQSGEIAGCVALRALHGEVCEMKRLYVRPQFRGIGLGRKLTEKLIHDARSIGYKKMRLDTIGVKMKNAVALYRDLGFHEIHAYRQNPMEGVLYMELDV